MIEVKGIHIMASDNEELHEFARKFVISKSHFSSTPTPHYEIINPLKMEEIMKYLKKK